MPKCTFIFLTMLFNFKHVVVAISIWGIANIARASDSKTPSTNASQITVSRTHLRMDNADTVQTLISTPYIREETRRSTDGKTLVRVLTSTILDNEVETITQTLFFVGTLLTEVGATQYDKKTRIHTQTKYAADGTFICKSITKETEPIVWRDEGGRELSPEQLIAVLKLQQLKAINLEEVKIVNSK